MPSFFWPFLSRYNSFRKGVDQIKRRKHTSYDEIYELEQQLLKEKNQAIVTEDKAPKWIWSFWLIGVVIVYLGYLIFNSLEIIYLILTAFILSMATESLIKFFQKRTNRGIAMFLSYLLLILFALSGFVLIIPFVFQQTADIVALLIAKINAFQAVVEQRGLEAVIRDSYLPQYFKDSLVMTMQTTNVRDTIQSGILNNVSQLVTLGSSYIKNASSLAVSIVGGFFSAIAQMGIVLTLSVFFSIEKEKVIDFMARASGSTTYAELKLQKLYKKLGFWLEGQLLLCLSIFLASGLVFVVLWWFGINLPNKFTLALIAGLMEFVPYLGPILGWLPAVLVATLSYGLTWFVVLMIVLVVIQRLENNILVPMVMYHTLWISPLLIFLCMIAGGTLLGILGILLAVPFAVILTILFEDYKKVKE